MKRDDLIAMVAEAPKRGRLTLLLKLIRQPRAVIAKRAGISASRLRRGTLSLDVKLRVARVVRVPASMIWPELQTLAWELLYGFRGRTK